MTFFSTDHSHGSFFLRTTSATLVLFPALFNMNCPGHTCSILHPAQCELPWPHLFYSPPRSM